MSDDTLACNPSSGLSGATSAQQGWHVEEPKKGAPLGIVTKTSSPPSQSPDLQAVYSLETGEITPVEPAASNGIFVSKYRHQYNGQVGRSKRFALKSVVNDLMPGSRTSKCMRFRAPDSLNGGLRPIEILKSAEHGKAFYQGLMACGSVWHCPVCAAKVSERRRIELKDALESAKAKGYRSHFVTLTFPHGISDDLNDILDRMRKAYRRLSSGKNAIKSLIKRADEQNEIIGFIRAIEVTHGKNGFHPHIHMIVFTNDTITSSGLEYFYKKAWKNACVNSGLPEPNEHGCTVKDGSYASEYVSKWGIEDEMTKANAKTTKRKGLTPWGLLQASLLGDDDDYPTEKANALFLVYANAFSGQRQLYWSNGLRKALHISKEQTDEEIVNKPDDVRSYLLAQVTLEQWKLVLRHKQEANLLSVAEANPLAINVFLENLQGVTTTRLRRRNDEEDSPHPIIET
ncbi:protein rep [Vibrio parahaemolyticus]